MTSGPHGPVPMRLTGGARLMAFVVAAAACPALGDPRPVEALADPALAAVGWFGPGPVPVARHGGCTGVLVAPDLVLTATHCMSQDERKPPAHPASFVFAPGWPGPGSVTFRAAEVFVTAPRTLLEGVLPFDLSLVRLERPVPASVAEPLPLAEAGDALPVASTAVAYPAASPETPVADSGCEVVLNDSPVLGFACRAESGYSGAPVLAVGKSGWEVQAIIVAQVRPESNELSPGGALLRTYAVVPPADLVALIDR